MESNTYKKKVKRALRKRSSAGRRGSRRPAGDSVLLASEIGQSRKIFLYCLVAGERVSELCRAGARTRQMKVNAEEFRDGCCLFFGGVNHDSHPLYFYPPGECAGHRRYEIRFAHVHFPFYADRHKPAFYGSEEDLRQACSRVLLYTCDMGASLHSPTSRNARKDAMVQCFSMQYPSSWDRQST